MDRTEVQVTALLRSRRRRDPVLVELTDVIKAESRTTRDKLAVLRNALGRAGLDRKAKR